MSEFRYSHVMREWVVIATERAKRPDNFRRPASAIKELPDYRKDCPFCPGNEGGFSDELFRIGDKKTWRVRCIPNKFPALDMKKELWRKNDDLEWSMQGFGVAEVVVENPRHNRFIALMDDGEVEDIIRAYKERYLAISKIKGIEAVIIFKNHGPMAGTSQEHPHSQIIATPVVSAQVRGRMESAAHYFDSTGKCLICWTMAEELRVRKRIILETENFVTFVPYAAYIPFAMWIVPRRHASSFGDITESEIRDFAKSIRSALGKRFCRSAATCFHHSCSLMDWP